MPILLLAFIAWLVWALGGLLVALVMRRHGHGFAGWAGLGLVLGPLLVYPAVDVVHRRGSIRPSVLRVGRTRSGAVDVLVGIDDTAASELALRSVLETLGPAVGRLTLATVVDYDTAGSPAQWPGDDVATDRLAEVAATVPGPPPRRVLLAGPAAAALSEYARDEGYDLLVLGPRTGRSNLFVSSVLTDLRHGAAVPVWIGPEPSDDSPESPASGADRAGSRP